MPFHPLVDIANAYLKSIATVEDLDTKPPLQAPSDPLDLRPEALDKTLLTEILPHSQALRKHILSDYNTSLSAAGVQDLHLLAGSTKNPKKSVLHAINHTHTQAGKCIQAAMLACPTRQHKTLQDRQATIKALGQADTGQDIDAILAQYKASEASLVSFYRQEDPLKYPAFQKSLRSFYFKWFGLKKLNTSSIALQCKKWAKDYWLHLGAGFWCTFGVVYNIITRGWTPSGSEKLSNTTIWLEQSFSEIVYGIVSLLVFNDMVFPGLGVYRNFDAWRQKWYESTTWKFFLLENFPLLLFTLIFLLLGIFFWYHAVRKYKRYTSTLGYVARRLRAFQQLVRSTEAMLDYLKHHPKLKALTPEEVAHLDRFLQSDHKDLQKLVYALKTLQLDAWSYGWSPQGKLLTTYRLVEAHQHAFADLVYALGKLDALRSVALHLDAAQRYSQQHHYTFVTFVKGSDTPVVEQKALWHPLLDANKVITNELSMDGSKGGLRTMVITGPNGGGKSTYLHAITVNLVLGQTFGIAACAAQRQTLFHTIVTYFDIVQDLSDGLSFFQAKVKGLKALSQALEACPQGAFVFCMLDEPLSGTAEDVSSKAGYSIMERFHTECPQGLFIIVTHLAKLTELAQQEGCDNRKVFVKKQGDAITYTYQIVPGIADQNIALDLLKKEGLLDT